MAGSKALIAKTSDAKDLITRSLTDPKIFLITDPIILFSKKFINILKPKNPQKLQTQIIKTLSLKPTTIIPLYNKTPNATAKYIDLVF
jgi:hypothetical protein